MSYGGYGYGFGLGRLLLFLLVIATIFALIGFLQRLTDPDSNFEKVPATGLFFIFVEMRA